MFHARCLHAVRQIPRLPERTAAVCAATPVREPTGQPRAERAGDPREVGRRDADQPRCQVLAAPTRVLQVHRGDLPPD